MTATVIVNGPELRDPGVVGHKFARQAMLADDSFPVPAFFCVPATAFDLAVADADDIGDVLDDDAMVAALAARRAAILREGVPKAFALAIEAAFDRLIGAEGLAAVRACVVPAPACDAGEPEVAEDGADDPFAGLSDSFLYVRRADVVHRVAECWASAYHPHAVRYRLRRGVAPDAVRVAVGVQRMIDGRRSFVAFTRDPRDFADRQVVAAAHGIGEGVVQERADIDHFFLDPRTGAIESILVPKSTMIGLDPAATEAGPTELRVPEPLRTTAVLTDGEVRAICALARDAERYFGSPQDVEGTITEDGVLHLVQSRPMVTPAPQASKRIWTNHNITESFPGVTCALTFSQAVEFYRLSFGDFYRRMGVSKRELRRRKADLHGMIGLLDNRVYYQLDAWYRLHGNLPLFGLLRPTWQRVIGLSGDELADAPPLRRHSGRTVRDIARMTAVLATLPWRTRRFLRWWDGYVQAHGDLRRCTGQELVELYEDLWSEFGDRWAITLVNSYFLLGALACVEKLLARWAPGAPDGLLPALLTGGRENRSLAALRSALALAELMRGTPALPEALREGPDERVHARIVAGEFGARVAQALDEHLRRYGDRTLHDLKLEIRTPRQQPWMLLALLRPLVEQELTVANSRADEQRTHRDGLRRLRAACPDRSGRLVIHLAVAALRWFIRIREDTRFCRSQLYGLTRDAMWRLGGMLAEDGLLEHAEDVVHLTVTEVTGAATGARDAASLRDRVTARRAALAASRERAQPAAYLRLAPSEAESWHEPAPAPEVSTTDTEDRGTERVLRGLASSSGRVRARARIVLSPTIDAGDVRDRILVARETDPGWLYLMLTAKGIVVERGSLLSHTAITGRLLGIPTVVAVSRATTGIADGRLIEIDGAVGTVRLLDPDDASLANDVRGS